MKKSAYRFSRLRDAFRLFLEQKKWWLTPMLITLFVVLLLIIRLMKYRSTDFIYSLF